MPRKFGTVGKGGPNGNPADINQPALGVTAGATWDRLSHSFSPITYTQDNSPPKVYTDTDMRNLASKVLFVDNIEAGVNPLFPEGVDRTYSKAPDFVDDKTSIQDAILSSSPYVPNTASPGAVDDGVNLNPMSPQRVSAKDVEHQFSSHPAVNDSDTTNPSDTSAKISNENIKDMRDGTALPTSQNGEAEIYQ